MTVEWDVWKANQKAEDLAARNAWLETVAEAISRNCKWREVNLCDLHCRGREFCKVDGLNVFMDAAEQAADNLGGTVCAG